MEVIDLIWHEDGHTTKKTLLIVSEGSVAYGNDKMVLMLTT